jgi:predicted permease
MAHRVMHMEFVVLAFAGLLLPVVAPLNNRRVGRRVFWSGFLIACVSALFIAYPPDWKSGIGLSLFAAGAISLGYQDAIWQYPMVRGQREQCVLVSVVTLGVFTIFYLGAYNVSKRRLLRRQQSGEYRAPRHQKTCP